MLLDEELKAEIRMVFEGLEYYARNLDDAEVQEIADGLVGLSEALIQFVKNNKKKDK